MAILATELTMNLTGGSSNTNVNLSLGGAVSSTTVSTTVSEQNLFANVTGSEASSGSTKYRCIALKNTNSTITLVGSKVWIATQTPSTDTSIDIGLSAQGLNSAPTSVANEDTAPASVSFSAPATFSAGLSTGDVPASQYYGVWIRRTVLASASAYDNDDWQLSWQGETTA